MAMEMKFIIHEAHTRSISAMGLNAHRKELWVAGRDGVMRIFDCNTGKLRLKLTEHSGHVTSISYYASMKAMFSTGIDGSIITWTASGTVYDKVFLSEPIYHLEVHARRRLAIVALKRNIRLFFIDEWKESGHVINMKRARQEVRNVHEDIVKKIVAHDLKVFSIGLDGALCMYEFATFVPSSQPTPSGGGSGSVQSQSSSQPQTTGNTHTANSAGNADDNNNNNKRRSAGSGEGAAQQSSPASTAAKSSISAAAIFPLHLIKRVTQAHGAGITDVDICRSASSQPQQQQKHSLASQGAAAGGEEQQQEKDQWVIVTSSYDHTVKIWTSELRLISTIELPSAVLGLAFCIDSQFVWVCSEKHFPVCIDPRTFENITEMKSAFHDWQHYCIGGGTNSDSENASQKRFEMLRYFRDYHTMVGVVDARDVVFWKFNPNGANLCMKCSHPTECITVTEKPPNFIVFTGDANGSIVKFENPATSHNRLVSSELDISGGLPAQHNHQQQQHTSKSKQEIYKMAPLKEIQISANPQNSMELVQLPEDAEQTKERKLLQNQQHSIQKLIFNEQLDLLIACNDDGMIYVWGYTTTAERKVKANKLLKKKLKHRGAAAAEGDDSRLDIVEHMLSSQAGEQKQQKKLQLKKPVARRKLPVKVKQKRMPPASQVVATGKKNDKKNVRPHTNARTLPASPALTTDTNTTSTTTNTTVTSTTISSSKEEEAEKTQQIMKSAPVAVQHTPNENVEGVNYALNAPPDAPEQRQRRVRTLSEEEAVRNILADGEGFENVLNRVAGFTCKHVLWGHDGTVSGLACASALRRAENDDEDGGDKPACRYLLSTGWDRRICLWDLEKGLMVDLCKRISDSANNQPSTASHVPTDMEYVADAQITDIDFCPSRGEFAYSSMDGLVYVRKFHVNGRKMTLLNVLDGYRCPVSTCRYHPLRHAWLTAGEDCSIRMWSAEDFNPLLLQIDCGKKVQVLSVDLRLGAILAGVGRELRVYDPHTGNLLQMNRGHRDNVSGIAHVEETDMYVTVCWDAYVRVFNAITPSQMSRRMKTPVAAKNSNNEPESKNIAVVAEGQQMVVRGSSDRLPSPLASDQDSVAT